MFKNERLRVSCADHVDYPGKPRNYALSWTQRRWVKSLAEDGTSTSFLVRTPRHVSIQIVGVLPYILVSGIQRQTSLLPELLYGSNNADGHFRETRFQLRSLIESGMAKREFQDVVRDAKIDDIPVARISNVNIEACLTCQSDLLDLIPPYSQAS